MTTKISLTQTQIDALTAGYIRVDDTGLIHCSGTDAECAEQEAALLAEWRTAYTGDDEDEDEDADLISYPASAALLAQVERQGGDGCWENADGVAITYTERDAFLADE